jgi:cobalt-zinc-cadmium efflux system outer membrane protein
MKKILLTFILITAGLHAESFEKFLDDAVKQNSYLKSSALGIDQANEEGKILTRYKNPSLELEVSQFSPDIGSNKNGYRTSYTQPIRLWGVGDDKEHLADAINSSATTLFAQKKAKFVRDISLLYTEYAKQKMLLSLSDEAIEIASKIYAISQARYDSGTISRGKMLQSKIAYGMAEAKKETLSIGANRSYYQLLKYAGIDEEIDLDEKYEFKIMANSQYNNPDIAYINANKNRAVSQAKVNSNKIENINVYADYEKEPNQRIVRAGVNIPLALFNTKSEEKQISALEAKKSEFLIKNENKRLNIEKTRLQKERASLKKVESKYKKMLIGELELLNMFEDGYKIASINLLELQDVKNKVIESKKYLIDIKTSLDKNTILTNYIQGNYNE